MCMCAMFSYCCFAVVFGIIIDTFATLRDEEKAKRDDMVSKCFICGIARDEFDRHADGFLAHIAKDHNMWQYVFLVMHLRFTQSTDFNGLESHIHGLIEQDNNSWVPMQRVCDNICPRRDTHIHSSTDHS